MKNFYFTIVNIDTNVIDADCGVCGLYSGSGEDDRMDTYPVDAKHKIIELTNEEHRMMNVRSVLVERDGKEIKIDNTDNLLSTDTIKGVVPKYQIDFSKVAKKIDDREVSVSDGTPVDIVSEIIDPTLEIM